MNESPEECSKILNSYLEWIKKLGNTLAGDIQFLKNRNYDIY